MKTERWILGVISATVCLWAMKMAVGVAHLAQFQSVPVVAAAGEIGTFLLAGAIPLWLVLRHRVPAKPIVVLWAICMAYVIALAVNLARYDLLNGTVRVLVWAVVTGLFLHALRKQKSA